MLALISLLTILRRQGNGKPELKRNFEGMVALSAERLLGKERTAGVVAEIADKQRGWT